jgi:hypothetical protein
MINLGETFAKFEDEFLRFDKIEKPLHPCPDICAFLLLYNLAPNTQPQDMVIATGHDELWLSTDTEKLASVASEKDICYLVRCGVTFNSDWDFLKMFVA